MKTPEEIIANVGNMDMLGAPLQGALGFRYAVAVIEALAAAGYVIVPKAPDLQMLNAASEALVPSGDALACWNAMIAAKP